MIVKVGLQICNLHLLKHLIDVSKYSGEKIFWVPQKYSYSDISAIPPPGGGTLLS